MEKEIITTKTTSTVPTATQKEVTEYSIVFQVVYLIFGLIEGLLALRFLFKLTGANPAAGFVRFLYNLTDVFMAPFRFIFPTSAVEGAIFEWSALVAIAIYSLFAWVLAKVIIILFTADTGAK